MSTKYKFHNKEGIYFITFVVVDWVDVFIRPIYQEIIVNSLIQCQKDKGMNIYAWCLMTNHMHMIFSDENKNPSQLIQDFKGFTSRAIIKAIKENPKESRNFWILQKFQMKAMNMSNVKKFQFWQNSNHQIELWSNEVIDEKVNYIHNNPVKAGFVENPWDWALSSAKNYIGEKGLIDVIQL